MSTGKKEREVQYMQNATTTTPHGHDLDHGVPCVATFVEFEFRCISDAEARVLRHSWTDFQALMARKAGRRPAAVVAAVLAALGMCQIFTVMSHSLSAIALMMPRCSDAVMQMYVRPGRPAAGLSGSQSHELRQLRQSQHQLSTRQC